MFGRILIPKELKGEKNLLFFCSRKRNSKKGIKLAVRAPMPKMTKYPVKSRLIYSLEKILKRRYRPNNTALPMNGKLHAC